MNKTKNVLDIYTKMYQMSEIIQGETLDFNRGFIAAVYELSLFLKNYEHINLHIENKSLKRKLLLAELALDDKYEDRHVLKKEITKLKLDITNLKVLQGKVIVDEYKKCEIEIEGNKIGFMAIIDEPTFNNYLPLMGEYIVARLSKSIRKKGPKHIQDYKVWCLQFLRDKGIKCIS